MGCTKIQPECTHCYAENETPVRVHRGRGLELWGPKAARHITGDENWRKPLKWNRDAAKLGERHRVFCASLADVFEQRVDLLVPRDRLIDLIEETPNLDWLLLTKRPENMVGMMGARWQTWPSNVWAGTTGGTQKTVDANVMELLGVPAAVHFLSAEPLLERIDIRDYLSGEASGYETGGPQGWQTGQRLDLVIAGGESGHSARPCDVGWIRSLRDQCKNAGTSFFCKQLGAKPVDSKRLANEPRGPHDIIRGEPTEYQLRRLEQLINCYAVSLRHPKGGDIEEWPKDLQVRQMP